MRDAVRDPDGARRQDDFLGRDAAERIATAIATGRASRVQPVRCEPWVWVRLDGGAAPEEIVLPSRAVRVPDRVAHGRLVTKEGASWLAAPTAH